MAYHLCIERLREATILTVSGRIDTPAAFDVKQTLMREASTRPNQLILDCNGVDCAQSPGLGAMLAALEAAGRTSVAVKLCGGDAFARHAAEVAGSRLLDGIFRSAQMALGIPADLFAHDYRRRVTA
jgi:anti-anti-sigma factor